ncbi:hypothetical protein BDF22DRAFT_743554 [Syncephalis plumigaleata]|nr:hypothetical protein BDF22DRAFT_743554 [Syncephalis plumigaleata]
MRSLSSVGSDATIFQTANGVKPKSSTLFTLVNKPSLQWDSISLSLTDTNEITSFNRGSPVPSLKSTATNASSFNKLAGKFGFRNRRYLTQTMFLSFSIILIITLTLIGLLLVQLVDPHAIGGKMMLDHPSGCLNGPIQWIPFVLPLVPLLFLIYQFIWLLWHIDDIYGIRHEVVVSVCSWIVTAIVSTSWLHFAHYDANSDSVMRVFPPSNLLAINAIVLHITSICWPLWLVRKDRNQLASVNVVSGDVDNIRKDDQLLDESGLHAIYSHITFHEMLQNPNNLFKEFTIRHLCVENVLFYEGCCLLLRVAQQHFQRPRSSSRRSETTVIDARSAQASTMIRSPQLQRRLKWFRKMFLSEDAELQVNLSSSVHRNLLDEIKRADAPFDTQPLRAARDEVEELMLRDIYPRYILASEMDMHEQTGIIQCMSIVNDVFIQQKPKKQKKEKEIGLILVL